MSNRKVNMPKIAEKKLETLDNLILFEEMAYYLDYTSTKLQKMPYRIKSETGTKYFFNLPNSDKEISFVITHTNKRINYSAKSIHLETFLGEWPGFFDSMGEGSLLADLEAYSSSVINGDEIVCAPEELQDIDHILQILRTRI